MDNLLLQKGLTAPKINDMASSLTAEKIKENKDTILYCNTFDNAEKYNYEENILEPGWFCSTLGNEGFFKLDPEVGMTADTVVKPVVEIENNSSLSLLAPSRTADKYRFGFGDIQKSSTVTWYVKTSDDYATTGDGFFYKLFTKDGTLIGGFESNPSDEAAGQYLHMNTADADRGADWSGSTAEETSAKLELSEWNRIDLAVDLENNTISGYVNYQLVETLAIPGSIASIDYLEIGSYTDGYKDNKRIYVDNLMLRREALEPSRQDVAANQTAAVIDASKNVVAFFTFNSDTEIVTDTTGIVLEQEGVYNYSDEAGCSTDDTVGLVPQTEWVDFRGVEDTTEAGGDTFSVRLVATTLDYMKIGKAGFEVRINGGKKNELLCDDVYDKLLGSSQGVDVDYSALGDFGAGYIFGITLNNLKFDETYTIEITPFTYKYKGAKMAGETYTFAYTNGVFSEVIPETDTAE
jgi:hypothetical protein